MSFVCTQFKCQTVLFDLSGATTPGQSGPVNDDNEEVFRIPQRSSINGASPSDCQYQGTYRGSYPSVEMQSVNSTAPADWVYEV